MASCISLAPPLFFKEIHENFSRIVASGELFMIIWDGSDMQHCSAYQEILFGKCSKPTWELLIIQTPLRSAYTRPGLNIHFGSGKFWLALHELAKRLILYRCNMSVWVTAVGMGTKHEMATAMPLYTACMRTKENSLTFTPSLLPPFSRLQPTWWGWRKKPQAVTETIRGNGLEEYRFSVGSAVRIRGKIS